jgi:hypothetical protein
MATKPKPAAKKAAPVKSNVVGTSKSAKNAASTASTTAKSAQNR